MRSRDIRRKYGQNYLTDKSVLFKMADAISPTSSDNFLEIGPGLGALTEQINKAVSYTHLTLPTISDV